ncbi:hypothetical protein OIV83_003040 [Microbotryomycetes sp. JL201]|nr:hypothetical protein OIV83_003040 [Microbotryomycetes sp. JL201]
MADEKVAKPQDQHVDLEAGDRLALPTNVAFVKERRLSQLKAAWCTLKRRVATAGSAGAPPSSSIGDPTTETSSETASVLWREEGAGSGTAAGRGSDRAQRPRDDDQFEAIVVDNQADWDKWGSKNATSRNGSDFATSSATPNAPGQTGSGHKAATDSSSLRHRLNRHFFFPHYPDKETEEAYQGELWWAQKRSHLYGSCFFVLNWLLQIATLARPWNLWLEVSNYGLSTIICGPLIMFVVLDWPRKRPLVWQIWVFLAVWIASSSNLIDLKLCGYYDHNRECADRDFVSLFFYAAGPPAIALQAMGQHRLGALLGFVIYIGQVIGAIIAFRPSFVRNIINLIVFYVFLLTMSYQRDMIDRRVFTMRAELKKQFRAKQRAEVSERKVMDSKRRLLNYVLHEVRVPLNTAMLAFQNMKEERESTRPGSERAMEWQALEGSLQMMSGVLNDILDFNRMERGSFGSVPAPFSLHKMMQSLFTPLHVEATNRGLSLCTSLDSRIDQVALRAAYPECEALHVEVGDGIVIGDEMRLRQILNNLSSNALKFTEAGGKLTLTTTMVYPVDRTATEHDIVAEQLTTPSTSGAISETTAIDSESSTKLSVKQLQRHNSATQASDLKGGRGSVSSGRGTSNNNFGQTIVVRFELSDTGSGLRRSDMADNRLFSPYVQSDNGKKYGGKGTGLGLSIVRQIVLLSNGRLGVKSKHGQGSTFWFEMPYRIGPEVLRGEGTAVGRREDCGPCVGAPPLISPMSVTSASTYSDTSDYKHGPPSLLNRHTETSFLAKIDEQNLTQSQFSDLRRASAPIETRRTSLGSATFASTPLLSPESPALSSAPLSTSLSMLASPPLATSSTLSSGGTASPSSGMSSGSRGMTFDGGALNVLVVDDDGLTRKLMSRLLTRLGCLVTTAENGAIALDLMLAENSGALANVFDIVFLDNQMPVMTGLQVVSKLRSLGRDDLVVGVTANAMSTDQDEYIDHGASAVLTKPVSEKSLRHHLTLAADKRAASKRVSPVLAAVQPSPPLETKSVSSLKSSLTSSRPALPRFPSEAVLSSSAMSTPKPSPPLQPKLQSKQ